MSTNSLFIFDDMMDIPRTARRKAFPSTSRTRVIPTRSRLISPASPRMI
ncbi:MAG: hypothetical protein ACLT98_07740 [Eggerthellaceae bacterium]